MTDPIARYDAHHRKLSPDSSAQRLSHTGTYGCPICRHGQVSALTLMDAFACSFCRHIFTVDLHDQTIRVEDSSQPMSWRWNGKTWQTVRSIIDLDLTLIVWAIGVLLIIVPSGLIWLSGYMFPPLPGSSWYWFPSVWLSLTFASHFLLVSWLLVEHYQLPLYVSWKIQLQDWLGRRE